MAAADTWVLQNSNTGADLSAVALLSTSSYVAVGDKSANSFVIRYTTDGGDTWQVPSTPGAPAGNNLNAIGYSGNTLVAVGRAGTITRSTDAGANWTFPASPTTKQLNVVAFLSSSIVVAAGVKDGNDYTVIRSTDGGATWGAAVTPANDGAVVNAIAFNGTTAIAVADKDGVTFTVLRSTDSGATWSDPASLPGGGQNLYAVAFVAPNTVVAVGANGTILASTDGGVNWAAKTSPTAQDLYAVAASGAVVVAVGQRSGADFTVAYSSDSGANWVAAQTPSGAGENLRAVAASSNQIAAVGDNGAILLNEGGGNWVAQNTGTLNNLFAVAIVNPVIAIGQNGAILRSYPSAASAGSGGAAPPGGGDVAVPFGGEWLVALVLAGFGVYYLRGNRR
jgi:photosystem II stability/assembly factor-like uncharacterized protein